MSMRGEGRAGANSPPGILPLVMCRVFGCVAAEPVSIRHELLEAENPIIRQSEDHDSGWGMAVYERPEGREPDLVRFAEAAHTDADFLYATNMRGRIFNVHMRRATMGALAPENTHPFQLGSYTLGHNGTILRYPRLLEPGMRRPSGDTDSEHLFNLLMHDYDPGDPVESLRHTIRTAVERSPFSGLNLLFSDGERLLAYQLGLFELHWLARPGQLLVASEKITDEPWHTVQQDVVLVLDPNDLEEPHAERLIGDELLADAEIQRIDHSPHLRGAARGEAAAERARAAAAAATE
jgi:predicted glutamine amidotransferase